MAPSKYCSHSCFPPLNPIETLFCFLLSGSFVETHSSSYLLLSLIETSTIPPHLPSALPSLPLFANPPSLPHNFTRSFLMPLCHRLDESSPLNRRLLLVSCPPSQEEVFGCEELPMREAQLRNMERMLKVLLPDAKVTCLLLLLLLLFCLNLLVTQISLLN